MNADLKANAAPTDNPPFLEQLIEEQGRILEMITTGTSLSETLEAIVLWAEKESDDEMLASILLLDAERRVLLHGAAPSLPPTYNEAIHQLPIGPSVGSCGTAAYTGEPVIVEDIAENPLWKDFRDLALGFNLRACWSTPLINKKGLVRGTFAMYYRNPKKPSNHDLQVIRLIAGTALLAIEWHISEQERNELLQKEQKSNELIRAERQNFYNLLMHAPAMIAVLKGPEHIFELANKHYFAVVGPGRDIIGKPIREALPELQGQGLYQLLDKVYESGNPFYGNEILVKIENEPGRLDDYFFNFIYNPIPDKDGKTEGIFVHAVDVTELVQAKHRAEESEERFRSFVLNSPKPIGIYVGREMRIQTANDAILVAWEKDRSIVGKTFREALPELEGQPFFQILDDVYTTGKEYRAAEDLVYLMRDGKLSPTYWDFTYTPLRNETGEVYGVMNTATEVTDIVNARQQLAEAEVSLRSAIEIAELGTYIISLPDKKISLSAHLQQWLSLPAEGATVADLLQRVHASELASVENALKQTLDDNSRWEVEFTTTSRDNTERILHMKGRVVLDEGGKQKLIDGVCRDITLQKKTQEELSRQVERRTQELQRANEELNHLNDNLKQFVYIASHDLQEPLRKIIMFSDMLKRRSEGLLQEQSLDYISKIIQATQRMSNLIKDLLDFSRADAANKNIERVDLHEVVSNVVLDYEMLIQEKNAQVHLNKLPTLPAIALQMNQLFYNLIGNALKFSKPGTDPFITISAENTSEADLTKYTMLEPGRSYTHITVADNGIGFEQEFSTQIFEIFQRLHGKEIYEGTGIGLALCKKIVENHDGFIFAEGKEQEGAVFHIFLPV